MEDSKKHTQSIHVEAHTEASPAGGKLRPRDGRLWRWGWGSHTGTRQAGAGSQPPHSQCEPRGEQLRPLQTDCLCLSFCLVSSWILISSVDLHSWEKSAGNYFCAPSSPGNAKLGKGQLPKGQEGQW